MTDQGNANRSGADDWDRNNDPDGYTLDEIFGTDLALEALLDMYGGDASTGSIGLTVVSGGVVVSGMLIGRQAWQVAILDSMRAANSDADLPITESFERVWDTYHQSMADDVERREAIDVPGKFYPFFHMRDALIDGKPVPLYRGLVTSITGWSIGHFTVGSA
jgi:hypothetical protein